MKVIFLDCDGVMLSLPCYSRPMVNLPRGKRCRLADPVAVAALRRIIQQTGAYIVVSSTWRAGGITFMRDVLKTWGIRGARRLIIGLTPRLMSSPIKGSVLVEQKPRGAEIQAWLDQTKKSVESFVIIDDEGGMIHLSPRLVKCKFETGLTMDLAEQAIAMLHAPRLAMSGKKK
jgi:hypothetical protein